MKLKHRIPSEQDLVHAYNEFQKGTVSLDSFMLKFEWCRYDPRLGQLLIQYLNSHWRQWNPFDVAHHLQNSEWPGVFGVLCSHVGLTLPLKVRKPFTAWQRCCLSQIRTKKEWSLFFIGINSFGGKLQKTEAFDSIPLYSQWGYFGKTPMVSIQTPNKRSLINRTLLSKDVRHQKLMALFKTKRRICISDYLEYLEFRVSIRTAELDLKHWARKSGNTKGARYTLKRKGASTLKKLR